MLMAFQIYGFEWVYVWEGMIFILKNNVF